MTTEIKGAYLLPRGEAESTRLDRQHDIFVESNGYLIHPAINLPPNPRIAEVATGSGAWILEAALKYPDATSEAFDISPDQFPTKERIKDAKVHFHVHDVREPFASQWLGHFDLVHVRLIVAGMNRSDWTHAAKNLQTLLKPGGVLQWTETDLTSTIVLRGNEAPVQSVAMKSLLKAWNDLIKSRDLSGARRLPEILKEVGLDVEHTDFVASDRVIKHRKLVSSNYFSLVLAWAAMQKEYEGKIEQLANEVAEEINGGTYIRTDYWTYVAKRPKIEVSPAQSDISPVKVETAAAKPGLVAKIRAGLRRLCCAV